jgi:glutathione synthase/RimK-type ligase-like ATP-grasp enzyme
VTTDGRARIGVAAPPDHPVFGVVVDRLAARGHDVSYVDPETPVDRSELASLSLFVVKRTRPASVRALIAAERLGVPTWNSATGVQACVSRFSQLCVLSGVGFAVPETFRERPPGEYVAKGLYHWHPPPTVDGEGDFYEELLPAEPVDYKYYVVDDGSTHHPVVLRATSKLWGEKRILDEDDPRPEHVDRIVSLMDRLGMRGVGVDLLRVEGDWYAVDLNPCPGFRETGLEAALVDSIESSLD